MPFFFDHYPYTNFHNVNLDWVLQAVKSWGQTVEANDRAFRDLKEANEDFKTYVENYLQDLDITDEINTKLDDMLASGVLTPYFAPYVQGYVNSWLNSHVTPTSPALDNTLTLSGAAARADTTGSRLKDLAYIDALSTPEVYAAINRSQVMPGYRVQGVAYDYNGHFYVCGGSVDEDGTGVIVKMSSLDFKDAEMTVIQQLGHANDITYYDGYLYVCTVGGGDAPQWGIYKINVNDFTDKTLISNAPENTIGITYRQGDFWLLAPYRIYRTTDFTSYEVIVDNTNNLMTAYGIPTSGRISQTIFRAAGYLIGWVCSFVSEERHYGTITFFSSTGQPIAFKMFPAYHSELQGAVYADMSIWLIADGNLVNVFRMDPRHLSYIQLKAGDDLDDFTGRGTLYSTGSNVSSELINAPSAGEGFTVQVERLGVYNTIQTARTNSGRELYRVKSFSAGTWGEWIEPAAEVAQIKEDLSLHLVDGIYDYDGATTIGKTVSSVNKWASSSISKSHTFKIPDGCTRIKVTANAEQTAIIAFLPDYNGDPTVNSDVTYSDGFSTRITINAGEDAEYNVTDTMRYLYTLIFDTSSNNHTPIVTVIGYNGILEADTNNGEEIETRLRCYGQCILGDGAYNIGATISMPKSSVLAGNKSTLIFADTADGAVIKMSAHCAISGLDIDGGLSSRPTTEGTRYGIEWTGNNVFTGFVDKCVIHGFSGAGLYLHDSTTQTYRNLLISNCRIYACYVGIDFNKNTEFNGVSNCTITSNYYGIRNRGGNNRVDCCGIDANYCGMLVNMDAGDNNGHGSVSNCTFNHSNSNTGYGIIIKDTGRMVVTGCNLYFSKILLENTNGNIINGCGFGNSTGWEITGGECNVFANCIIKSTSDTPITITNNTQTKVVNCYTRDGVEVAIGT